MCVTASAGSDPGPKYTEADAASDPALPTLLPKGPSRNTCRCTVLITVFLKTGGSDTLRPSGRALAPRKLLAALVVESEPQPPVPVVQRADEKGPGVRRASHAPLGGFQNRTRPAEEGRGPLWRGQLWGREELAGGLLTPSAPRATNCVRERAGQKDF